jgi:uncharacterized protein (DUF305 family)
MNNYSSQSLHRISLLILAATLGLSACATTNETSSDNSMGSGGMMASKSPSDASGLSRNDVMFLQMMIPHHEQAVEMSTLAETNSTNPEVLALAA